MYVCSCEHMRRACPSGRKDNGKLNRNDASLSDNTVCLSYAVHTTGENSRYFTTLSTSFNVIICAASHNRPADRREQKKDFYTGVSLKQLSLCRHIHMNISSRLKILGKRRHG